MSGSDEEAPRDREAGEEDDDGAEAPTDHGVDDGGEPSADMDPGGDGGGEPSADMDPGGDGGGGSPADVDPQAEAEQIVRYLEALRVQMRGMEEQGEYTRIGLEDNARARSTLESMGGVPDGQETLVPVGAGTFIRASKGSLDRVMVSLGRGVVAEVSLDKARDILEGRNKVLEAQYENVLQNMESLKQQAVSLQARLEQLTTAVEPPNVNPLGR